MCDVEIAKKYLNKKKNAEMRGVEFDLPLLSFINLYNAKKCYYTGITLTKHQSDPEKPYFSDFTIDRLDSTKGYVKGNVVACCYGANQLKAMAEASVGLSLRDMTLTLNKCKRLKVAGGGRGDIPDGSGVRKFLGPDKDNLTGISVGKSYTVTAYKGNSTWLLECTECGSQVTALTSTIKTDKSFKCGDCE
jgi:hypothetical protein